MNRAERRARMWPPRRLLIPEVRYIGDHIRDYLAGGCLRPFGPQQFNQALRILEEMASGLKPKQNYTPESLALLRDRLLTASHP